MPVVTRENGDVMAASLADASRPLGVELGPARVQAIDLGARRLDGGVAALQRVGVRGDAGIVGGAPVRLEGGFRLVDRLLHPVHLALLEIAEALAARRRRGG